MGQGICNDSVQLNGHGSGVLLQEYLQKVKKARQPASHLQTSDFAGRVWLPQCKDDSAYFKHNRLLPSKQLYHASTPLPSATYWLFKWLLRADHCGLQAPLGDKIIGAARDHAHCLPLREVSAVVSLPQAYRCCCNTEA